MINVLGEAQQSLRASPIFAFYVLVTLGVAGIIGLITFDFIDLGMAHFGEPSHRTHDVTYGLLFTTGVIGVLAQLRRPKANVAGMLMALLPVAGLALAAVLSGDDAIVQGNPLRYAAAVTVIAALVHPAGRGLFGSFSVSRVNWAMIGLVAIAAAPLLAFASTNIGLQRSVPDMHGAMGHYGFMAAFGYTVVAGGLLASMRPVGWRLTARVSGLLPAALGVVSILSPNAASSLDLAWALASIAWGATFVAAAGLTSRAKGPALPGQRRVASNPTTEPAKSLRPPPRADRRVGSECPFTD